MKQRILVDVANRQKMRIPVRKIKKIIKEILEKEEKMGQVSVVFVDDKEIRELNKRFLKKDRETDVLAFPLNREEVLGEVIISVDTAKRDAKEDKKPFISYITLLLIHGILHILGYKHSKEMRKKQELYLKEVK